MAPLLARGSFGRRVAKGKQERAFWEEGKKGRALVVLSLERCIKECGGDNKLVGKGRKIDVESRAFKNNATYRYVLNKILCFYSKSQAYSNCLQIYRVFFEMF